MADYTIERWLRGMVDYDVPSDTLCAILFNNRVPDGLRVADVPERERDLCLADLLMWLSSSSTATSGEYVSDGGWQHQKSNKNVTDRTALRQRAQSLYAKWDPDKAKAAMMNKVSIKAIY